MEQMLKNALLATIIALWLSCLTAQAQLRVVSWNTAGGPREGLGDILEAIGNEEVNGIAKPIDILSLQEQNSVETTTQAIVNVLNDIYGDGTYARGFLNGDTSGAGRPGIIYNKNTVSLRAEARIGNVSAEGQARQSIMYRLAPVGYNSELYLFSSHVKAGTGTENQLRRLAEATAVRGTADFFVSNRYTENVIYTGDYNIRSSSEFSYQKLLSQGPAQAFDPINVSGVWHDNDSLRQWHTQAPATGPSGGLAGGGVDDRFDFQLVNSALIDGEGYSYIPGSYRTFGNNGTHNLNGDISSGTGASPMILNALEAVSDHLPVVADYQVPALWGFDFDGSYIPRRAIRDSIIEFGLIVENTADVVSPNGADELEYSLVGTGGALGAYNDTDMALGGGNTHVFRLDTSTLGTKSTGVNFDSHSPESRGDLLLGLFFDVIEATADFDNDSIVNGSDFLTWQRGVGVGSFLFEGDADGSRVVDAADLAIWESQFGSAQTTSSVAVPEPTTIVLLLGFIGFPSFYRSKRQVAGSRSGFFLCE